MTRPREFVELMRAAIRLGVDTPEGDRIAEQCDQLAASMTPEENKEADRLLEDMIGEEIIGTGRLAAAFAEYGLHGD